MPGKVFVFSFFCKFSRMFILNCFVWAVFSVQPVWAQQDPEFPAGGVVYAHLSQGVVTAFDQSADNYLVGLGIHPQYTIVPGLFRMGLRANMAYTQKQWYFMAGPSGINLFPRTNKNEDPFSDNF